MRLLNVLLVISVLSLSILGSMGCKKKVGADSRLTSAQPRVIAGANLTGASLKGIDLAGKDLAGTNFTQADLSEANFTSCNLNRAVLSGAQLTGARSGGIQGVPKSLPEGWKLLNGYLVGPGANLRGAILTYAKFDGMKLDGVDFTGANLLYASFNGTSLNQAHLSGALMYSSELHGILSKDLQGVPETLPKGWRIERGQLVGP